MKQFLYTNLDKAYNFQTKIMIYTEWIHLFKSKKIAHGVKTIQIELYFVILDTLGTSAKISVKSKKSLAYKTPLTLVKMSKNKPYGINK